MEVGDRVALATDYSYTGTIMKKISSIHGTAYTVKWDKCATVLPHRESELRLIEAKPPQLNSGDRVVLVEDESNTYPGTVRNVNREVGTCNVKWDHYPVERYYSFEQLRLITPAKVEPDFKIGDRVFYTGWGGGTDVGTILEFDEKYKTYRVKWDRTGYEAHYNKYSLKLVPPKLQLKGNKLEGMVNNLTEYGNAEYRRGVADATKKMEEKLLEELGRLKEELEPTNHSH